MSGPTVAPIPRTNLFRCTAAVGMPGVNNHLNASQVNAFRISAVIYRLNLHLSGSINKDTVEFFNLCLSLSRGIDFSITNGEVPITALELPPLLKQVCHHLKDFHLVASIMVLMISVKNACKRGWFAESDSKELMGLASEIANAFGSAQGFDAEPRCSDSMISTIMSRFFPRMKMHHMFAYLEVKPGFDTYMMDFMIGTDMESPPGSKLSLFVVQIDNTETSSCLITPPKVNFLVNGMGVEKRTNIVVDTGPQIPTLVTKLLRYGSNLLQAVGEFNGNYIVAVCLMTEISNPCSSCLKDYELAPVFVDSDSEIIEGSSRVSINCPISFKRIKTPVKGHLCKHIQCFDYDNYVDINSRRPSWRCPHCNQSVCFTDLRVDQKMLKILKEVETTVSEIIVSSDGSWSAVLKTDEAIQKPEDKTSDIGDDVEPQPLDMLDLTTSDDVLDCLNRYESEDRKPFQTAIQDPSSNPDEAFWSTLYLSTLGQIPLSPPSDHQLTHPSVTETNTMLQSPSPDSDMRNTLVDDSHATGIARINENSLQNASQMLTNQNLNTTMNEYGRSPSVPPHITRIPVAVQALPAPSVLQKRPRNHLTNSVSTVNPPVGSQALFSAPAINQSLSANSFQGPWTASTPLPQYPMLQSNQLVSDIDSQQNRGLSLQNQAINAHGLPRSSQQLMTPLHLLSSRPPPGLTPPSMQSISRAVSLDGTPRMTGSATVPRASPFPTGNRNTQMGSGSTTRTPHRPMNNSERLRMPPLADDAIPVSDAFGSGDPNWRPSVRMRGALSGKDYMEMLNQFMMEPTQQATPVRPAQQAKMVRPFSPVSQSFMADRSASGGPSGSAGGFDLSNRASGTK